LHFRFLVIAAGALALAGCNSQKPTQADPAGLAKMPAIPVSVAPAEREAVPVEVRAVGSADPFRTVQVKSQIAGELVGVRFAEGSQLRKGDLLFQIDPRPYQEALRQAVAAVAKDSAQLKQSEANLAHDRAQEKNAQAESDRYDELFKEGIAARNQHEQMRTAFEAMIESVRADEAAIESARASLESDRAAAETAKLNLSFCEIRSPVSGRAGNLLVHAGNLVKANGDNALVVINQIEPIFVSFAVPEHHLAAVRARMNGGGKLVVEVSPGDAAAKTVQGYLTLIDNAVDATTGTIKLKAVFENRDHALWPGQFVNVVLRLETSEETVVPSEAVQSGQQGQFVYVVKPDRTVEFRPVAVGSTVGGKAIIEKGVAPGETVVTDGQLLLFPGARIQAVPASRVDSQKL
jgi:multidrug efflux system membrane fusion protein